MKTGGLSSFVLAAAVVLIAAAGCSGQGLTALGDYIPADAGGDAVILPGDIDSPDGAPTPCKNDADCDDENVCTTDKCTPGVGCEHLNNTAPCDDSDPCTEEDVCLEGVCTGGHGKDCDDDNACTDDSCDPASGCVHTNNTAGCEDGDACTLGDTCKDGQCEGAEQLECKDENPCTDDLCDPATGCSHPFNDDPCDDGNACTTNDKCTDEGGCEGTPSIDCKCDSDADCKQFDDENLCNGALKCIDELCKVDEKTVVFCDSTGLAACKVAVCIPATGKCGEETAADGAACDNGDKCTANDECKGGICQAGKTIECNDGNVCTDDSCKPADGCIFTPNTADCDDGNECTAPDKCAEAQCQGTPVVCNDDNPCTDDSCDAVTGCVYTNNTAACTDDNSCTENDICLDGKCAGASINCDDGNPCTDDTCDAAGCVNKPNTAACDDGNKCTIDDKCKDGACADVIMKDCDDNNACTSDTCVPAAGCVNVSNQNPCNDNNPCTINDICKDGKCGGGGTKECNDNNPCTADSCEPATGCVNKTVDDLTKCDDGNACTNDDVCSKGICAGVGLNCDDKNPCTDDKCDNPAVGCYYVYNKLPCDDLDACTAGDLCNQGACKPGAALECDDKNPCTNDKCDSKTGCVFTNNTQFCSDGDACTTKDQCKDGKCVGGAPKECDGNPCTDDNCNSVTGCQYTNNTKPCEDGNVCTGGDTCAGGGCLSGKTNMCNGCNMSDKAGCNGCSCEQCVCAMDPFCCEVMWDAECVSECKNTSCPQTCEMNGCNELPQKGCGGCGCETLVCAQDPYCCNNKWDSICVAECKDSGYACGAPGGPGCQASVKGEKGCGGCACEKLVCEIDPFCCNTAWDSVCVNECKNDGGAHCYNSGGQGCKTHETKGCESCSCQSCVCKLDAYCCTTKWDQLCVDQCTDECGATCQ